MYDQYPCMQLGFGCHSVGLCCHVNRLEAKNNTAARTILGAPSESGVVATCREALLLPFALVAKREASALLLHAQSYPPTHVLHQLSNTAERAALSRSLNGGFRSNWFDVAKSVWILSLLVMSLNPGQK